MGQSVDSSDTDEGPFLDISDSPLECFLTGLLLLLIVAVGRVGPVELGAHGPEVNSADGRPGPRGMRISSTRGRTQSRETVTQVLAVRR
jgi:hypothetical protein